MKCLYLTQSRHTMILDFLLFSFLLPFSQRCVSVFHLLPHSKDFTLIFHSSLFCFYSIALPSIAPITYKHCGVTGTSVSISTHMKMSLVGIWCYALSLPACYCYDWISHTRWFIINSVLFHAWLHKLGNSRPWLSSICLASTKGFLGT